LKFPSDLHLKELKFPSDLHLKTEVKFPSDLHLKVKFPSDLFKRDRWRLMEISVLRTDGLRPSVRGTKLTDKTNTQKTLGVAHLKVKFPSDFHRIYSDQTPVLNVTDGTI
jgi:hypothetical protein